MTLHDTSETYLHQPLTNWADSLTLTYVPAPPTGGTRHLLDATTINPSPPAADRPQHISRFGVYDSRPLWTDCAASLLGTGVLCRVGRPLAT